MAMLNIIIHIVPGRDTGYFLEDAAEIKSTFKPQQVGNLVNLVISACHHFNGGIYFVLADIIGKSHIVVFGEEDAQVIGADAEYLSYLIQCKFFFNVFADIFLNVDNNMVFVIFVMGGKTCAESVTKKGEPIQNLFHVCQFI